MVFGSKAVRLRFRLTLAHLTALLALFANDTKMPSNRRASSQNVNKPGKLAKKRLRSFEMGMRRRSCGLSRFLNVGGCLAFAGSYVVTPCSQSWQLARRRLALRRRSSSTFAERLLRRLRAATLLVSMADERQSCSAARPVPRPLVGGHCGAFRGLLAAFLGPAVLPTSSLPMPELSRSWP